MLLDHFHPPLSKRRHWRSFLCAWAVTTTGWLNEHLPKEWYASPLIQSSVQEDANSNEERDIGNDISDQIDSWIPSPPGQTVHFSVMGESYEVHVIEEKTRYCVGSIEFVSPSHKHQEESRYAFVSSCEKKLLGCGGIILVDIVANRKADLHKQLLQRFEPDLAIVDFPLFGAAYRIEGKNNAQLETWHEPLTVGGELPTLPLYLKNGPLIPVDLSATYQLALKAVRIEP